jgi:hypothetical protein
MGNPYQHCLCGQFESIFIDKAVESCDLAVDNREDDVN